MENKMTKKYDVVGIGSPLLDIIVNIDDDVLRELGLGKGEMSLTSKEESEKILEYIKEHEKDVISGGSVANTISGTSLVGNKSVLLGVIGDDDHGEIYERQTQDEGVHSILHRHDDESTGHAITFITKDGERTFATHLGAAAEIRNHHIMDDEIKKGKFLHIEAYQLENPLTREAMFVAMDAAKNNGVKVGLDLSDPWLIDRTGNLFKEVVEKYADVVFANEDEATKFTGLDEMDAVHSIADMCETAVVKLGKKGSLIKSDGKLYKINPHSIELVNTNGAGDMYAAGVIHGIVNDLDLHETGKIASHLAALVVASSGARMDRKYYGEIERYRINRGVI